MHPAGAANPGQVQGCLAVHHYLSHGPPTQGFGVLGPIIRVKGRGEEGIKCHSFVYIPVTLCKEE